MVCAHICAQYEAPLAHNHEQELLILRMIYSKKVLCKTGQQIEADAVLGRWLPTTRTNQTHENMRD